MATRWPELQTVEGAGDTEGLGLGKNHHGDACVTASKRVATALACAYQSGRATQSEVFRLRWRTGGLSTGVSATRKSTKNIRGLRTGTGKRVEQTVAAETC